MTGNINNNLIEKHNIGCNEKKTQLFRTLFLIFQIQFIHKTISIENRWSKEIVFFVPLIVCLILFLYSVIVKKEKINRKSFVFTLFVIGATFLTILINADYATDNFIFIIVIVVAFFISNIFTRADYLKAYVDAMLFYSIFSLISTYLIHPIIMKTGVNIFPTYVNKYGVPFLDLGFAYVVKWNGLMRNQGYFNEPGVFQFYILVAIIIEFFYLKRKNRRINIIVLFVTLLSTFSTAGYISLIPILIIVMWKEVDSVKVRNVITIIGLGVFFYLILSNNENIVLILNRLLVTKFQSDNGSFIVRYESIPNLLKMSLHRPVFGNSFVKGFVYIQQNYNRNNTVDITGTLFSFIMALGYPVGLILWRQFYKLCKVITGDNGLMMLGVLLALFLSVNTQNLIYDSLFITLLFLPFMKMKAGGAIN